MLEPFFVVVANFVDARCALQFDFADFLMFECEMCDGSKLKVKRTFSFRNYQEIVLY